MMNYRLCLFCAYDYIVIRFYIQFRTIGATWRDESYQNGYKFDQMVDFDFFASSAKLAIHGFAICCLGGDYVPEALIKLIRDYGPTTNIGIIQYHIRLQYKSYTGIPAVFSSGDEEYFDIDLDDGVEATFDDNSAANDAASADGMSLETSDEHCDG